MQSMFILTDNCLQVMDYKQDAANRNEGYRKGHRRSIRKFMKDYINKNKPLKTNTDTDMSLKFLVQ